VIVIRFGHRRMLGQVGARRYTNPRPLNDAGDPRE
jgi:hypothetical protein